MLGRLPARLVLLVLAVAGGAAIWHWWNSPERQISRIFTAVASALSHDEPGAGLDALTAVAELQKYLVPEVSIDTGASSGPIAGRQEVVSLAARLRAVTPMMRVQWFDVAIAFDGESRAAVRATAQVTTRNAAGEEMVDVHQVEGRVEKREEGWMVVTARQEREGGPGR
jgi:hypothetical protein